MEEQYYTIILRHDTSTKWLVNDPILYLGEYGVEDDTHKVKRGDGESKWSELPYEDFGLQYIVTFENLHGNIENNQKLVDEFEKKIDKRIFNDVNNSVVTGIIIVNENIEEGKIADITRTVKNIRSEASEKDTLVIKSSDKTVQGFWSINEQGNKVLNLRSASSISDYEPGKKYYKDQLCYNNNKLYRAYEDIVAETVFNPNQWSLLASLHSGDIKYDNLVSSLDATTVKEALDELKRRDDRKVQKSTEGRVVYGTDQYGQQTVIQIDDLRKVDTVNHKQADLNKNIQIDANSINYNDAFPEYGTVKTILDAKVDKQFAGQGAKIVRDIRLEYNTTTGHITLVKDKVSPEDGSSILDEIEIDVVSEQELNTAMQGLQNQIDESNTEIERVETESKTRDNTINSRIDDEIQTLNETIDTKIAAEANIINSRIDDEIQTLNETIDAKDTAMNNKKLDKDIASLIVTEVLADVDGTTHEPTMKIVRKNTTTKESVVNNLHFSTNGSIQTRFVDADHIQIDSSAIDTINTQQNSRLTAVETAINTQATNITTLFEHDANHDRAIAANASQIATQETRLGTAENNIINLNTGLQDEVTNRTTVDANLSTRIADNAVRIANNTQSIRDNAESISNLAQTVEEDIEALTNAKVDKDFAENINNKIVGKLESDNISGLELFNLKETMISPIDGISSIERIKIISSDGTVVATRGNDGTIDLATNLDTDVNYFVTTETISTTIAAETTLDMTKLTPTDKIDVEVQDIISDPEGTWGRVKSIDTTNNTCVVVTFKKHAQAVWGTIKGTLADQTDLQSTLSGLADDISDEATTRQSADNTLQSNIDTEEQARIDADATKVDKVNTANKVYGTDSQGNQTTYNKEDFGKVDTVNGVQVDANKNIKITGEEIQVYSDETIEQEFKTDVTIKQALDTFQYYIEQLALAVYNRIRPYIVNDFYYAISEACYPVVGDGAGGSVGSCENFVTFTRDDGVMLMAKVLQEFTADNTQPTPYESFMYDVEQGNLKFVGIPEQVGETQPTPIDPNLLSNAVNILWNWLNNAGRIGAEAELEIQNPTANGNVVTGLAHDVTEDYDIGTFEVDVDNEQVTEII